MCGEGGVVIGQGREHFNNDRRKWSSSGTER